MEVNPRDPVNTIIVNLDRAPTNGRGMVEFSAPFFILKPVDMLRSNHKIYYAINNRGNKSGLLSHPPAALLPSTNNPLFYDGDGLQLRLGYTIVDAGWQGDVAEGNARTTATTFSLPASLRSRSESPPIRLPDSTTVS
jgi:hypothetical protein